MICWPIGAGFPNRTILLLDNPKKYNSLSDAKKKHIDDKREEYAVKILGCFIPWRKPLDIFISDTWWKSYIAIMQDGKMSEENRSRMQHQLKRSIHWNQRICY